MCNFYTFYFVDSTTYFTSTICGMKQTCMKLFNSYIDEIKNTIINALKAEWKDVIILTSLDDN